MYCGFLFLRNRKTVSDVFFNEDDVDEDDGFNGRSSSTKKKKYRIQRRGKKAVGCLYTALNACNLGTHSVGRLTYTWYRIYVTLNSKVCGHRPR